MNNLILDDLTVDDLKRELECDVLVVEDIYSTKDLISFVLA